MSAAHKHWDFTDVDLVTTALKSTVASNPHLGLIESERVVFNKNEIFDSKKKVIVLSGGGSGHEPLHGGFVGKNLLDIAVAGAIFASPSTKQILSAITTIDDLIRQKGLERKGYLIVVKNYTGDVLHFGLAAERAKNLGFDVELAIVEDDVSVGKSNGHLVGRRGLAGTALVHKFVGGLAAEGKSLAEIKKAADKFIGSLVTIGASLDHCSIPGRKISKEEAEEEEGSSNALPLDSCEIGMGIHNETGVKRIKIPKIDELVTELLNYLLNEKDEDRSYVKFDGKSDDSVLVVNNLGGTSNLELYTVATIVLNKLAEIYHIKPVRVYIGDYTTSLNGNGFSITLLNLAQAGSSGFVLQQLDKETNCVGWNSSINWVSESSSDNTILKKPTTDVSEGGKLIKSGINVDSGLVKAILESAIKRVTELEPKVTEYDTVAGDGDCGETLLAGCKAITKSLEDTNSTLSIKLSDPVAVIFELANLLEDSMGGTSGGLYSIFMSSLAVALKDSTKGSKSDFSIHTFAGSLQTALDSLFKYTRARTGDKTLIDALEPFIATLNDKSSDLQAAKSAAIKSAKATIKLDAKFGRASYVSKDEIKKFHASKKTGKSSGREDDLDADEDDGEGGIPDPGALGLAAIIDGAVNGYYNYKK